MSVPLSNPNAVFHTVKLDDGGIQVIDLQTIRRIDAGTITMNQTMPPVKIYFSNGHNIQIDAFNYGSLISALRLHGMLS